MSLLGSLYFIFFGLGGLLTFPVMDKIGRRKTHFIFSTSHLLAQALIIFVPTFAARAAGFSLMGFMMAKNSLAVTWAFEYVQKEAKPLANSAINSLEFLVFIVAGLYYLLISRDWWPLIQVYFCVHIFGYILVTALCVESPKWLLFQSRRKEAIDALNYIAKVNRSKFRISASTQFTEQAIAEAGANGEAANGETEQSRQLDETVITRLDFSYSQAILNLS